MIFLVLFLLLVIGTQLSFVQDIDESIVLTYDFPSLSWLLVPFNFWISLVWIGIISYLIYRRYGEKIFTLYLGVFFATLFIEIAFKMMLKTPVLSEHIIYGIEMAGTFPSGHVLRATLAAGGLRILGWSKAVWLLPIIEAVVMITARGHWPTDLLGGWLLGMAGLLLIASFLEKKNSAL